MPPRARLPAGAGRVGDLVAGGSWVASRVVAQALEFCAWVLLARRLDTGDLGLLAVAVVVTRLAGLVGDWGAAHKGAREVARHGAASVRVAALVRRRERVSTVLAVSWLVGSVLVAPVLWPLALVVVARGAGRDWIALGSGRRRAAAVPPVMRGVVLVAGAAVASTPAAGVWAFAGAAGVEHLLSRRLNPRSSPGGRHRVPVDAWYLVAGLADQVLISGDTVVLAVLRSGAEAGVYASVYRYPAAWLLVVGLAVSAAVPRATRILGDRGPTRAEVGRAVGAGLAGALVVLAVTPLAVASVTPVFGVTFGSGRVPLAVLMVAAAVTTASAPLRLLYVVGGDDRVMALVTVGAAGVNLVANLALVGRWGMTAAALTTLGTQILTFAYFAVWARRSVGTVPERVPAATVASSAPT